jgi:iron complex outermembrane receptor protein
MMTRRGPFVRTLLGIAAALLAHSIGGAPAASAQSATSANASDRTDTATYVFDIPAQPLSAALETFRRVTGWQISIASGTAHQGVTRAVVGKLTAERALRRMLGGTGLVARIDDRKHAVLERGPSELGVATLAATTINAKADGYVATHSTAATKSDIPLIEIPQSISVVSRGQLDVRAVETLNEALRYSAGVTADPYGTDTRLDWLFIRGFDQSATGIYRDGTRWQGDWVGGSEPYDIQSVEVLRGPTSVLYGQNGPGGLVNLVTKRPPSTPLREIKLQAGTFDQKELAGDVGGPLTADGTWLYRLTALGRFGDTPIDSVRDNYVFAAPALTWRPSERTELTFLSNYSRMRSGYVIQYLPAQGTVLPNPNGRIPRNRFVSAPDIDKYHRTLYTVGTLFQHRFDDTWNFRQNARYGYTDIDDGLAYGIGFEDDLRTLDRSLYVGFETRNSVTVDNQLTGTLRSGRIIHNVLVGLDYRYATYNGGSYGSDDLSPIDVFDPVYTPVGALTLGFHNKEVGNQTGAYAQDQVTFGDRWHLLAGGRMDWTTYTTHDIVGATTTKQRDNAFSGRVGVVYTSAHGLAPYATYSESFSPVIGTDVSGTPYEPETGQEYEVGLKLQPSRWNGFLTLSLFNITKQNVLTIDPDNPLNQLQAGEWRSRGIEVEGNASLPKGINLTAAYTYLDLEVTKSNDVDLGKRPQTIPDQIGSLWADYTIRSGSLFGLGFGAGVRYTGSTFIDLENTLRTPPHTLFDAALYFGRGDWHVGLNAKNVFDRLYAVCWSPTGCNWGDSRTVTGDIQYRW